MRRVLIGVGAFLALSLGGFGVSALTPHSANPVLAVASPSPMESAQPSPTATPDPASPSPSPAPAPSAAPPNPAPAQASFPCVVTENGQLVIATCTGSHSP